MQIQYELLKKTSKRTFESYIRNSRQIKNSWKISPYTFFLSLKNNGAFSHTYLQEVFLPYYMQHQHIKRGSQWDYNRQPSNCGLKFNHKRQKCKLILAIKRFHGISNLAFLSVLCISADLHGRLAPEEPPNQKTSSDVLRNRRLLDITKPSLVEMNFLPSPFNLSIRPALGSEGRGNFR